MRKMLLLGLVLVLLVGCKKKKEEPPAPTAGSGSGQFGTVQAVRMAAVRTVNLADLDQIRLFIETASTSSGRMPTVQEINAALQKEHDEDLQTGGGGRHRPDGRRIAQTHLGVHPRSDLARRPAPVRHLQHG